MMSFLFYAAVAITGCHIGAVAMMAEDPVPCTFPDVPGAQKHVIDVNVAAWTCTQPNTSWSSGDLVVMRSCDDGVGMEDLPSCVPSPQPKNPTTNCTDPPPVPWNAVLKYSLGPDGSYGKYYECDNKMAWMSGVTGRLSQCINGSWSFIGDVCEEECEVPRDCDELARLGFKESGMYKLVPSGNVGDPATSVWCDLEGKKSTMMKVLSPQNSVLKT